MTQRHKIADGLHEAIVYTRGWNAAIEKMQHLIRVRQSQWPKRSSMYASLEDIARDAEALVYGEKARHE